MSKKRLFHILDEMNVADGENNTANLGVCDFLIEAKKAKGGGHVTMGVPEQVVLDLVLNPGKKSVILLIVDKSEYDKIENS